jgi:CO dehydrogenase/acetyl-CoA synthase gamma subunit (corrinoid Fe-S protein)
MGKIIIAITEEDNRITNLASSMGMGKHEVIILGLNLVSHIVDQRKAGKHIVYSTTENKTKEILTEATDGDLPFSINDREEEEEKRFKVTVMADDTINLQLLDGTKTTFKNFRDTLSFLQGQAKNYKASNTKIPKANIYYGEEFGYTLTIRPNS